MKANKKQIFAIIVVAVMLMSCVSALAAGGYRTLYAPDGRSKSVPVSRVAAELKVGWYEEPVQMLYAEGKSKVFLKTQVAAQLKVGWHTEPVQRLYTEDGRSKLFPKSKVAAHLKVGWYEMPVQRLYAPGKSKVFPKTVVAAQLKVGWYQIPVSKIYAEDGRTKIIKTSDVEAYKKVGWYISPVIKMYYPDGKIKKIADVEKASYEAEGWYSYPVDMVYAPDGREKVIKASDVAAYKKVGWSTAPFFMVKCENDDWYFGKKRISWQKVPGVTNHTVTIIEKRMSVSGDIPANKPVVIKNVTNNYVDIETYPRCSYTIKVTGGESKGETTIYAYGKHDYEIEEKIYKSYPKSKEEADKLMVKITVPIWKLSNGKKVSSTATLTVHKLIAEPTKAVFNEIYRGKEKFPFKDIGAYYWRGGRTEHNSGTAIDLNSNENYCIYPDGTTIGSHWKPGVDPYSINPYGDVVRAFEKHGFTWGGDSWSSPNDYMHFSYLGT